VSFHVEGIVSRREWPADCDAEPSFASTRYASLQEALAAIGRWVDDGKYTNVVCFNVYEDKALAWSVSPLMPSLD
jgi:hypothetical protein